MKNKKIKKLIFEEVLKHFAKIVYETLTTHRFDNAKSIVQRIAKTYDVIVDSEEFSYNTISHKTDKFDDVVVKVIIPVHRDDITDDEYKGIEKWMRFIGYEFSRKYKNNFGAIVYEFIPFKQDAISYDSPAMTRYIYHICPNKVKDKIMKYGLIPKSKNTLYSYTERIHFFTANTPKKELKFMCFQLSANSENADGGYSLLTIDTHKIKNIDIYKDLTYEFGVYSNEPINKSAIVAVEDIEPIPWHEYVTYRDERDDYIEKL